MIITHNHLPKKCYSDKYGFVKDITRVDGAIIHYISAVNVLPDDPYNMGAIRKIFEDYKVSAHYLIDRDGEVIELVPLPHRAFHAGKSIMDGRMFCNSFTVGIELVGGKWEAYPDDQLNSLYILLKYLMNKYGFSIDKIRGHDAVREEWNNTSHVRNAPVKEDPGPLFPWDELRERLS